jgi:hypothetical protein
MDSLTKLLSLFCCASVSLPDQRSEGFSGSASGHTNHVPISHG